MSGNVEGDNYSQPALFGFEDERSQETLLEHMVVETLPTWKQQKGSVQWHCQVSEPADIFNQARNDSYEIHARADAARQARKKNLRPGDIVTLQGRAYTQEIETTGGKRQLVHHLNVTRIDVLSRSKRVSLTVYEKRRGR